MLSKLYQEMKKHGVTQAMIARRLGISANSVNNKLQGKRDFTATEMYTICEMIDDVPMHELFKKD